MVTLSATHDFIVTEIVRVYIVVVNSVVALLVAGKI
jgi:hypothetical protein